MLVQNYGWATGPAKIWLWLARRPFGWPRASGKHDPWYPLKFIGVLSGQHRFNLLGDLDC